jgi:hypothetical protein
MKDALEQFHENKNIFIDLRIRSHFNIPKIHTMHHYPDDITLFGTTDNYNTEQTERLHIDMAKNAYRASNRRNEYPQMTIWLERREKILRHNTFIQSQTEVSVQQSSNIISMPLQSSKPPLFLEHTMTKHPSVWSVSLDSLHDDYGAVDFGDALADFVTQFNNPDMTFAQVQQTAPNQLVPFQHVPVFHHLKFRNTSGEIQDSIHAQPNC